MYPCVLVSTSEMSNSVLLFSQPCLMVLVYEILPTRVTERQQNRGETVTERAAIVKLSSHDISE